MKDMNFGGSVRLLKTFFLFIPSGIALLLMCLPLTVLADAGVNPKKLDFNRCAAAISGDRYATDSLDEQEATRCVDLMVNQIAKFQPVEQKIERGKPPPPPPTEPPARFWHAFTSNGSALSTESRLFMFGGFDGSGDTVSPDLWYYSDFESGWKPARTGKSRPSPRAHIAWSCGAGQCVAAHGSRISNFKETWVYSEANATWTQVNCRRKFCPSERNGASMAYDPERAYHVLFGGHTFRYSLGDTHTFAGGRWTSHITGQAPARRGWAATAFVPREGVMAVVMHGGQIDDVENLNDMFAWNGSAWVEITSVTEAPYLHSHSMIWDETTERLVVTGGYTDTHDTANQAVWYFRFETETSGSWSRDDTSAFATCVSAADPGARMALDRATGEVVLFGGLRYEGGTVVATDTLTVCDLVYAPNP